MTSRFQLVAHDAAVLHFNPLLLDPSPLDVAQGFGGALDAYLNSLLEARAQTVR